MPHFSHRGDHFVTRAAAMIAPMLSGERTLQGDRPRVSSDEPSMAFWLPWIAPNSAASRAARLQGCQLTRESYIGRTCWSRVRCTRPWRRSTNERR